MSAPVDCNRVRQMQHDATISRVGGFALLLLIAVVAPITAQEARISGRIRDPGGRPLGGAEVVIREMALGSRTDASGAYTLVIAPGQVRGQQVTLVARMVGHAPASRTVALNPGSAAIDFTLPDDPLHLDELVVTGFNSEVSTRKLPFAVGRVSADQLQETPAITALGGLAGKVAGLRVVEATGTPGVAPRIRLRGSTSISGSQDPLIIIDGTISRASLADIASEDIDRIEVIKGAAASSLYGSDAANGVIQVFTRRGRDLPDGKLLVTFRNEIGASFVTRRVLNANAHAFQVEPDPDRPGAIRFVRNEAGSRVAEVDLIADNPYPDFHDQQGEVLRPGLFFTNYLSIGQRRGSTNLNLSFQNNRTEGVLREVGGYRRQNLRANLDQQLSPRADLELSAFYGRSTNDQPAAGEAAAFFEPANLEPHVDILAPNPGGSPYRAFIPDRMGNVSNPLYVWANELVWTDRLRFMAGGRLRWRMLDGLTAEGSFNYDHEAEHFDRLVPFGFLAPTGRPTDGSLTARRFTGRTYNLGATLTARRDWSGLSNTTKLSYSYEDQISSRLESVAGQLFLKQVSEFTAGVPSSVTAASDERLIRNRSAYIISTFDVRDRYIIDGLIRRDQSSLFGPDRRTHWYYRVSGAWRANEDLHLPGIDELRLRASYGTAGLRPGFDYRYETLDATGGSYAKERLGNRQLRPAHSSELEAGFNLEAFDRRLSVEYTWSRKETRDQITLVDLPGVIGYRQQWRNVGALRASTQELALGWQPVAGRDVAWTLNLTADRTRQTITDWPLPTRREGLVFREGEAPLGVYVGQKLVRRIEELYDDPEKQAQSGPGGFWSRDSVVVNEEGYVVRRNEWRTAGERPILYRRCQDSNCTEITDLVPIGDANPDFVASLGTSVNYRRLVLSALVGWSQGGNIYNLTRQAAFYENRDRVYDQRGKPEVEKKNQRYYNVFFNAREPIDYFVESGTWVKLKEFAVHYTLGRSQLRHIGLGALENLRLGLIGRNLFTLTSYSGYDPEAADASAADPFQLRVDFLQYPHFRTLTGLVEIAF